MIQLFTKTHNFPRKGSTLYIAKGFKFAAPAPTSGTCKVLFHTARTAAGNIFVMSAPLLYLSQNQVPTDFMKW